MERSLGANITYSQANLYVRNKKGMHQAMTRDGWHLPSYNSPIVTMDWLMDVRFRRVWCPK